MPGCSSQQSKEAGATALGSLALCIPHWRCIWPCSCKQMLCRCGHTAELIVARVWRAACPGRIASSMTNPPAGCMHSMHEVSRRSRIKGPSRLNGRGGARYVERAQAPYLKASCQRRRAERAKQLHGLPAMLWDESADAMQAGGCGTIEKVR